MRTRRLPGETAFGCPKCDGQVSVIDSRPASVNHRRAIRRRRKCNACDHRFTTFETEEGFVAATNIETRVARIEHLLKLHKD